MYQQHCLYFANVPLLCSVHYSKKWSVEVLGLKVSEFDFNSQSVFLTRKFLNLNAAQCWSSMTELIPSVLHPLCRELIKQRSGQAQTLVHFICWRHHHQPSWAQTTFQMSDCTLAQCKMLYCSESVLSQEEGALLCGSSWGLSLLPVQGSSFSSPGSRV